MASMFSVQWDVLMRGSETLLGTGSRLEAVIDILQRTDRKLSGLSCVDEVRVSLQKEIARLETLHSVLSRMGRAAAQIGETYQQTEQRIEDNYETQPMMRVRSGLAVGMQTITSDPMLNFIG